MTEQERMPRPLGTTMLGIQYHKDSSTQNKEMLLKHILHNYLMTGFLLNGKQMNIQQLSIQLRTPLGELQNLMVQNSESLASIASIENIENLSKTILAMSTNWAIEDRGKAAKQLDILQRHQGDTYMPFVSGEVNRAIELNMKSNAQFLQILQTITKVPNITIINPKQENKEQKVNQVEAIKMISDRLKEIPLTDTIVQTEYPDPSTLPDISPIPEVRERQKGHNTQVPAIEAPSSEKQENIEEIINIITKPKLQLKRKDSIHDTNESDSALVLSSNIQKEGTAGEALNEDGEGDWAALKPTNIIAPNKLKGSLNKAQLQTNDKASKLTKRNLRRLKSIGSPDAEELI